MRHAPAALLLAPAGAAAAADSLNRAFAAGGRIDDQALIFYGYLDRADVYQRLAERCDFEPVFEPCLEAVRLARRDYKTALGLAQELGWSGVAHQVQGSLDRLGIREQLIQSQVLLPACSFLSVI